MSEQNHTHRKIEITHKDTQNWMEQALDACRPYQRAIWASLFAVLFGMIAWNLWQYKQQEKAMDQWGQFVSVLSKDVQPATRIAQLKLASAELGETNAGYGARLQLATELLNEGTQKLYSDRADATKKLNEAKGLFEKLSHGAVAEPA